MPQTDTARTLEAVRGVALAGLPDALTPRLLVVVHTEIEFDWTARFDRSSRSIGHLAHIERIQSVFDAYRIRPMYVVDYPVAAQREGIDALRPLVESGRAEIGAHLHPWVTPPFKEKISTRNSFPGNLPGALEREKLSRLTATIERGFGFRPTAYLAGRYGFGMHTVSALKELGYELDLSATPPFDYSAEGGPDYSGLSCHPRWLDTERTLLGIAATGGFVGALRGSGAFLHRRLRSGAIAPLRLTSWLARVKLLERIRLSPEGFSAVELRKLTEVLVNEGIRYFVFSFHSPSIVPGNTEYVRDTRDLERLLDVCRAYFEYFGGELDGVPSTPSEVLHMVREHEARNMPDRSGSTVTGASVNN